MFMRLYRWWTCAETREALETRLSLAQIEISYLQKERKAIQERMDWLRVQLGENKAVAAAGMNEYETQMRRELVEVIDENARLMNQNHGILVRVRELLSNPREEHYRDGIRAALKIIEANQDLSGEAIHAHVVDLLGEPPEF